MWTNIVLCRRAGNYKALENSATATKIKLQSTRFAVTICHSFNVPADWRGKRVFIVFEGVMTDASVKINGTEAGPVHQGAFYRFKYDCTELLKFGEENLLEVSVSDKSSNASVNNAERNADYWVFGGIFRPVWLQAEPAQFVDRVAIDARADGTLRQWIIISGAKARRMPLT